MVISMKYNYDIKYIHYLGKTNLFSLIIIYTYKTRRVYKKTISQYLILIVLKFERKHRLISVFISKIWNPIANCHWSEF